MILDIIIIGIVLITALIAGKLGFIRTVYQLVSSIIALVLAVIIYPIIESILKLTPLYSGVQSWVADKIPNLSEVIGLQEQGDFIREATSWLPEFIGEYLVKNNNSEVYNLLGVQDLIHYITVYIADICIAILAIAISWVVVKIALSIFVAVLDVVSKLPILRTANMVAGFGAGIAKGIFTVWMVFIAFPVLMLIPKLSELEVILAQSLLGKFLYENNLILQLINQIMLK